MITIIGAGMAGLLAGNMLERGHKLRIMEAQSGLPNNHGALLRFRSNLCSDVTGIPFKKVHVNKAVKFGSVFAPRVNPYLANQYSLKVTGEISDRSIWNLDPVTRYIAPMDFINRMAVDLNIKYAMPFNGIKSSRGSEADPVISTIPMPVMMDIIGWKHKPKFKHRPIWTYNVKISNPKVDVYQTIYYPDLDIPHYRASLCGDLLTIEFVADPSEGGLLAAILEDVLDDFGLRDPLLNDFGGLKRQEYGKLVDCDDEARKDFIYTLTREYNIYSLGRFATWRQILLDDVVEDVKIIQKLINSEGARQAYHRSLQTVQH